MIRFIASSQARKSPIVMNIFELLISWKRGDFIYPIYCLVICAVELNIWQVSNLIDKREKNSSALMRVRWESLWGDGKESNFRRATASNIYIGITYTSMWGSRTLLQGPSPPRRIRGEWKEKSKYIYNVCVCVCMLCVFSDLGPNKDSVKHVGIYYKQCNALKFQLSLNNA